MAGESMFCLQAWADSDDRDSGTRKRRCRPGEHLQEGIRAAKRRDLGTRHPSLGRMRPGQPARPARRR